MAITQKVKDEIRRQRAIGTMSGYQCDWFLIALKEVDKEHQSIVDQLANSVPLPVDINQDPIHIGDNVIFQSEKRKVIGIGDKEYFFEEDDAICSGVPMLCKIVKQDTIEQIKADITRSVTIGVCSYYRRTSNECSGCPAEGNIRDRAKCATAIVNDVVDRTAALYGGGSNE